jgi:hypothetical protein
MLPFFTKVTAGLVPIIEISLSTFSNTLEGFFFFILLQISPWIVVPLCWVVVPLLDHCLFVFFFLFIVPCSDTIKYAHETDTTAAPTDAATSSSGQHRLDH